MNLFGKKNTNQSDVSGEEPEKTSSLLTGPGVSAPGRFISPAKSGKKGLLALVSLLVIGGVAGGYFYLIGMEGDGMSGSGQSAAVVSSSPAPVVTAPAAVPENPVAAQAMPPVDQLGQPATAAPGQPPVEITQLQSLPSAEDIAGQPASPAPTAIPVIEDKPSVTATVSPQPQTDASPVPEAAPKADEIPQAAAVAEQAPVIVPAPAEPDQAELAIVQNSAVLDSLDHATDTGNGAPKGAMPNAAPAAIVVEGNVDGKKVSDILAQQANIRPLPKKYLIVKKEHDAGDLDSRLTAARTALAQGQLSAALELFNDLYSERPKDKRVLMGRAVAMQRMGQNADALSAYEEALNNDPKNVEALTNMLGILKNIDKGSAIERLSQLREAYPYNTDITAQLGIAYGVAGQYDNALKYLNMADAMKPGSAEILYNKAVVYDRMGKISQASDLYRQIVLMAGSDSIGPNFPIETVRKRLATIH